MSVVIYILKLENDKYYVGKTKNPNERMDEHMIGNGSVWTKLHKPVKIVDLIHNCNSFDEDKYTLMTMSKYGIDNVRGGSFSSIILDKDTIYHIKRSIHGAKDKCFKCGSSDHWASQCGKNNTIYLCTRCGRNNHNVERCYAKTHRNGTSLSIAEVPIVTRIPSNKIPKETKTSSIQDRQPSVKSLPPSVRTRNPVRKVNPPPPQEETLSPCNIL